MGIWRSPSEFPALLDNEIHVWRSPLLWPQSVIHRLAQTLSDDEQRRSQRFRFERHQHQFIASRGLLRTLLAAYLDTAPEALRFTYGAQGKPELDSTSLPGPETLTFNMSHSHEMVLYGITRDGPIGVDVEHLRPIDRLEQLAQRFFAPAEYDAIAQLPDPQKSTAFFCGWTRKEAYLKATGRGLIDLSQVEVSLLPDEPPRLIRTLPSPWPTLNWHLYDIPVGDDYQAALAIQSSTSSMQLRFWDLNCVPAA